MSLKKQSMKNLLVSIIIPAFNAEQFIEETINSALNQTYSNIEIIVIDDGSTDNTRAKIVPYKNIKYIYQENCGISQARNRGIENAGGEYVAFLDADDLWVPNKTEIQMNFLFANPEYAAVSSDWQDFENDKIISESYLSSHFIDPNKSFYENLLRVNVALTSTVIVRKEAILQVGMFDDSFYPWTYEDRDLMLRIAAKYKFHLSEQVLVKKRHHQSQISKPIETIIRSQIILFSKLRNEHPILPKESIKFIERRLLSLYIDAGYYYLKSHNMELTRNFIKKAIKLNPYLMKSWKIFILSYFPIKLLT